MKTAPLGYFTAAPFGDFLNSLRTAFFVIFGNNWTPIYFDLIYQRGTGPVLYFLTAASFGKQLLFNFIVAFLLEKMQHLSEKMRLATRSKHIQTFKRAKEKLLQMRDRKDGAWFSHLIGNKVHQDTSQFGKASKLAPNITSLDDSPAPGTLPNLLKSPVIDRNNPNYKKLSERLDSEADGLETERNLLTEMQPRQSDLPGALSGRGRSGSGDNMDEAKQIKMSFGRNQNTKPRKSAIVNGTDYTVNLVIPDVPRVDFSPAHPPVARNMKHKVSLPPISTFGLQPMPESGQLPMIRKSADRLASVVPVTNPGNLLPIVPISNRSGSRAISAIPSVIAPTTFQHLPSPRPKHQVSEPPKESHTMNETNPNKPTADASMRLRRLPSSSEVAVGTAPLSRLRNSSLFILHVNSPLRKRLKTISSSSQAEITIAIMIIIVAVLLAIDSPSLDDGVWYSIVIRYLDILLNSMFSLEILVKILAYGGIWKSQAQKEPPYFHKIWNVFDFSVVMLSWVTYMIEGQVAYLRSFKVLRILRLMGPIRSVLGSASLDLIVEAIFASTSKMIIFTFFILLCCQPFTVMGLHSYPSEFNKCQSKTRIGSFYASLACDPATESPSKLEGFRTYFGSLFNSVVILTNEGFKEMTHYLLVDPTTYEIAVDRLAMSFLAYYVMGCFLQNMYACLTILNYKEKKQSTEKTGTMNSTENMMFDLQKVFIRRSLNKDSIKQPVFLHKGLYSVIHHFWFDVSLLAIFIANVGFIIASGTDESPTIFQPIRITQLALLLLYNLEIVLKVVLQGPRTYIADHFNKIDCISTGLSNLLLVLYLTDHTNIYFMAPILLRFFTIGRFLRRLIVQDHPISRGLKSMLQALNVTLVSLAPLLLLVFIFISLFSIIGMNLFYRQPLQSEINSTFNFRYFFSSFLLLLKTLTGFRWDVLVREIAESAANCRTEIDENAASNIHQCGQPEAYAFFIAYLLISRYLLANLVTVLVIDGYLESKKEENLSMTENQLDSLYDNWSQFSPTGNGLMKCDNFILFLNAQVWPCGVKLTENLYITPRNILNKFIYTEDLKIVATPEDVIRAARVFPITVYEKDKEYYVHFVDYISQLCGRVSKDAKVAATNELPSTPYEHPRLKEQWVTKFRSTVGDKLDYKEFQEHYVKKDEYISMPRMDLYRFYRYKVCIRKMMSYAKTRKPMRQKIQTKKGDYIKEIGVEASMQARHQNISYLYHHNLLHIPSNNRKKRVLGGSIFGSASREEPAPTLGMMARVTNQLASQLMTSGSVTLHAQADTTFGQPKNIKESIEVLDPVQNADINSVQEMESVTSNLDPIFRNSEIHMKEESSSKSSESIDYFEN